LRQNANSVSRMTHTLTGIHTEVLHTRPTAVVDATLTVPEIGPWLATVFGDVATAVAAQGSQLAGPPFARYLQHDDDRFTVEAGFPVVTAITPAGEVRPSTLPGGTVATTTHIGPYEEMEPTYRSLIAWVAEQGGELDGAPWEVYLSDPSEQPDPSTWRTEVRQPYRAAGGRGRA